MPIFKTIFKATSNEANSTNEFDYSAIFIYESELNYISRCILDYPNIETGGNLFGHYTKNGIPIIEYVIGPGASAIHAVTQFQQEKKYLENVYSYISESFALSEVGAWHSHHQLDLAHPSGGDIRTVMNGLEKAKLDEFIIVIGNFTPPLTLINAFVFANKPNKPYRSVEWHVLKGDSPFRERIDSLHDDMLIHPKELNGNYIEKKAHVFEEQHWLSDKNNVEELKTVLNFIKLKTEDVKVFHPEGTIIIDAHCPQQSMTISFAEAFLSDPYCNIVIKGNDNTLISEEKLAVDIDNQSFSETIIQYIKDRI